MKKITDKKRLDWLNSQEGAPGFNMSRYSRQYPGVTLWHGNGRFAQYKPTVRQAIDADILASKKPASGRKKNA